ncbi:MAG: hypothetical protein O9972_00430 [Burkholderiales bacterium]|nr:hypothetical protein [Burkholderiales bacterium]
MKLADAAGRRPLRLAAVLAAALLAGGCALGTGDAPAGTSADASRLPGVSDRTGSPAVCRNDLQPCANGETCCAGLVCAPHGRFGQLCRRPAI